MAPSPASADAFTRQHERWLQFATVKIKFVNPNGTIILCGAGSGVIVKSDHVGAFILTNYHVTVLQSTIKIRHPGYNSFIEAQHVWSLYTPDDTAHDLAVYFCHHKSFAKIADPVLPSLVAPRAFIGEDILSWGWPRVSQEQTKAYINGGRQKHTLGKIVREVKLRPSALFETAEEKEVPTKHSEEMIMVTTEIRITNSWSR